MSAKAKTHEVDSMWPAVERALRGQPRRIRTTGHELERVREQFGAAIIRHVEFDLALVGVRIPEEC